MTADDYTLFFSFIVLVPCAFVLAVLSKIRHVMAVIAKPRKTDDALEQRQRAFDLQVPSRRWQSSTMPVSLPALTSLSSYVALPLPIIIAGARAR